MLWGWTLANWKFIHTLHPKMIGHIRENKQKNKCVCIHEIIRSIIMKMKVKIKNRWVRYDIIRPRSRHRQKYSKYKKCLAMMMLTFMKKLSNIEAELKKNVAQKKQKKT